VIARLGRSGINSSGPHLHFHVSDRNSPLDAEGMPYVFRSFHLLGTYKSAEDAERGAPCSPVTDGENSVRLDEMPEPNWVSKTNELQPGIRRDEFDEGIRIYGRSLERET